jgi:hypothetical protein
MQTTGSTVRSNYAGIIWPIFDTRELAAPYDPGLFHEPRGDT